jgi:hypothetical protein
MCDFLSISHNTDYTISFLNLTADKTKMFRSKRDKNEASKDRSVLDTNSTCWKESHVDRNIG